VRQPTGADFAAKAACGIITPKTTYVVDFVAPSQATVKHRATASSPKSALPAPLVFILLNWARYAPFASLDLTAPNIDMHDRNPPLLPKLVATTCKASKTSLAMPDEPTLSIYSTADSGFYSASECSTPPTPSLYSRGHFRFPSSVSSLSSSPPAHDALEPPNASGKLPRLTEEPIEREYDHGTQHPYRCSCKNKSCSLRRRLRLLTRLQVIWSLTDTHKTVASPGPMILGTSTLPRVTLSCASQNVGGR